MRLSIAKENGEPLVLTAGVSSRKSRGQKKAEEICPIVSRLNVARRASRRTLFNDASCGHCTIGMRPLRLCVIKSMQANLMSNKSSSFEFFSPP